MPLGDDKTMALAALIAERCPAPVRRALVVGCGAGSEAAVLAKALGAGVVGVDLIGDFDPTAAKIADLRVGDATALDFPAETFDLVFSYHALEHIPDYRQALREMRRVLAPDGRFCIGTPNRSRLVGYLGSKDATALEKLQWNYVDWKLRLRGRFRNEFGAHAGWTAAELRAILSSVFSDVSDISAEYYSRVYSSHPRLIRVLTTSRLDRFAFPAVYCFGAR